MKPKRLLYLMHVSWFWIKQRPQFLAEEISFYIPTTVACMEDYCVQSNLNKFNVKNRLTLISFFIILFKKPSFIISKLNFRLKKIQLGWLINKNSIIWFNSPFHFLHAKKFIKNEHMVVYDCMDNFIEFLDTPDAKENLRKLEAELCQRANYIIVSANALKKKLAQEYNIEEKVTVINNALNSMSKAVDVLPQDICEIFSDRSKKYVVYIGTIATWFNFEETLFVLKKFPNLRLVLIGPIDCDPIYDEQIIYCGPVNHSLVNGIMNISDALIMPFKINELVRCVNPVKAYEYISSGKPVILSKYEETYVFEKFAYLYEHSYELQKFFDLISSNKLSPKMDAASCLDFAKSNTWKHRAEKIIELIKN